MKPACAHSILVLLLLFQAGPRLHAGPPLTVSLGAEDGVSAAGASMLPQFSGDSRHLVFLSHANNLVGNDNRAPWLDVFVRDLVVSNTVLVSVNTNGIGGGDADSFSTSISSNGQFVAFVSRAANLSPADDNDAHDIFVRDLVAGTTRIASLAVTGGVPRDPAPLSNVPLSDNPMISADGRWLFFESRATNLVAPPALPGSVNIYRRDLWSNITVLVSATINGTPAADEQSLSSISADGRFAAFTTTNRSFVSDAVNPNGDVYVRDLLNGTTAWASSNAFAELGTNYSCSDAVLSDNGAFVAFATWGTNGQVRRVDLQSGESLVLSHFCDTSSPFFLSRNTFELGISADGEAVAFRAAIPGAVCLWRSNSCGAIAVTNGAAPCPPPAGSNDRSASTSGLRLNAAGDRLLFVDLCQPAVRYWSLQDSNSIALYAPSNSSVELIGTLPHTLSPDGAFVAFQTADAIATFSDYNNASDIFLSDTTAAAAELVSRVAQGHPALTGRSLATLSLGSISADGGVIAYTRYDEPSAFRDTNGWPDVFITVPGSETSQGLSIRTNNYPSQPGGSGPATNAPINTNMFFGPVVSADGSTIAALQVQSMRTLVPGPAWLAIARSSNGVFGDGMTADSRDSTGQLVPAAEPSLSRDGRMIAFSSSASTVTYEYDPLFLPDIFVRSYKPLTNQLFAATNYLVSRATNGGAGRGMSTSPVISLSGQFVAYMSKASNLVVHPSVPQYGSLNAQDIQSSNWPYAAFQLVIANLGTNRDDTNVQQNIQGRLGSYTVVSNAAPYTDFVGGRFWQTALMPLTNDVKIAGFSENERYLIFSTPANGVVYRHDLLGTRTNYYFAFLPIDHENYWITNVVEPGAANVIVCTNCGSPTVTADGWVVAYERGRAGGGSDVFCVDLRTGRETLLSTGWDGLAANGSSTIPLISAAGRYVVFQSAASNLVPNDINAASDVFVRDRVLGATLLASANPHGQSGNGPSSRPVLGPDGRTVAFQSFADDLVPGDYSGTRNVFVLKLAGADTDQDGMDDDWEVAYFGDLSRNGAGDFDGDGVSDRDEFLAGTDPTNGDSIFRLLRVSPAGGGSAQLLWTGNAARAYRVEFKDDLNTMGWTPLDAPTVWNGTTAAATDAAPGTNRFYRVIRLP